MLTDNEYHRLAQHPPRTLKGRVRLASHLIRHGRAASRLYDGCFEQGDGAAVLAQLMRKVRAAPALRDLMAAQGVWEPAYAHLPDPGPLPLTEADRTAGFIRATCGMAGARRRWRERAAHGLTETRLAEALADEIGAWGGRADPDGLCLTYRSAGLRIWISWEIHNAYQTPPTYRGGATIAKARAVYGIKDPSETQLALF